jgi:hypothetical protein
MDQRGERVLTLGEKRVRLGFNPSGNERVDKIKRIAADLIDLCEEVKVDHIATEGSSEVFRLLALAQTHAEDAAMWAVKAATA